MLSIPGTNNTGWQGDFENSNKVYFFPIILGSLPLVHKNFLVTLNYKMIQVIIATRNITN